MPKKKKDLKADPAISDNLEVVIPTSVEPSAEAVSDAEVHKAKKLSVARKLTQWEKKERQKQVLRLRLRGLSEAVIAKALNVSTFTVNRDLKTIQEANSEQMNNLQRNQFVAESLTVFGELSERAWSEVHANPTGTVGRLKALDLVRIVEKDKLSALVDTGLIQKVPPVVIEPKAPIMWSEEAQQAIAQIMLKEALRSPVIEPTLELLATEQKTEDIPTVSVDTAVEDVVNLEDTSSPEEADSYVNQDQDSEEEIE